MMHSEFAATLLPGSLVRLPVKSTVAKYMYNASVDRHQNLSMIGYTLTKYSGEDKDRTEVFLIIANLRDASDSGRRIVFVHPDFKICYFFLDDEVTSPEDIEVLCCLPAF